MPMLPTLNDVSDGCRHRPGPQADGGGGTRSRRRLNCRIVRVAGSFTTADKLRILAETDRAADTGGIRAILRREGLYSSALTDWRRQRAAGVFDGADPGQARPQGHRAQPAGRREWPRCSAEHARLTRRLARAEAIIEVQKKVGGAAGSCRWRRATTCLD